MRQLLFFFFFSSRRRHTRCSRDWSSDVCSSDLVDTRLWVTSVGPRRATGVLRVEGSNVVIDIPQPGLHNLENAAAATLVALELGVDPLKVEIGRASCRERV